MGDAARQQGEGFLAVDVLEVRLGRAAAVAVHHRLGDVAHDHEHEEAVHQREAQVEIAQVRALPALEVEHLRLVRGEGRVDRRAEGVQPVAPEDRHVDGHLLREARHRRNVVWLLDHRDEAVVPVEDHQAVRQAAD